MRDYVKMLCENRGLKFLIFAFHHNMMNGIAEELFENSIKYIRIDGQTPGQERPVSENVQLKEKRNRSYCLRICNRHQIM